MDRPTPRAYLVRKTINLSIEEKSRNKQRFSCLEQSLAIVNLSELSTVTVIPSPVLPSNIDKGYHF
jgi:hypothetical protein